MSTGYKIVDTGGLYCLTFQVVDWVDIFTRRNYRDMVLESPAYCIKEKGLIAHSYVIMSNHLHLTVRSKNENLSEIVRDMKKYTSKAITKMIQSETKSRREWLLCLFERATGRNSRNSNYQIWTQENHAEYLYSNQFITKKLTYIHNNPVKAGIVGRPEDYLYSSAVDYAGGKRMLEVEVLYEQWRIYAR
jgi:REP element-mobilizing transposase RayT